MLQIQPPAPGQVRTRSFLLEDLRVDPATGALEGPGVPQSLDPRVMAVLTVLASTPGELVSRGDLLEAIWPGGEVYDDALTQCVYELRRHLEAAGGQRHYRDLVQTLPKRGYILRGDVRYQEAEAHPSLRVGKHRGRQVLLLLATLLILVTWLTYRYVASPQNEPPAPMGMPANFIAVLPFVNAGSDGSDDHLSEGLSDGLRDRLSARPELRIAAWRSSSQFRGSSASLEEVRKRLGVGRVVEGRFLREGPNVRLSIELVDTQSGFREWTRQIDYPVGEQLLIERNLATELLNALLPGTAQLPETTVPTLQAMQAHDLILLGRQYERQITEAELVDMSILAHAIDLYRQALEADPESAEAHADLARTLLYQGDVVQAEPHVLEALRLGPQRSESFTMLGLYYWAVRRDGAGAAWKRAIELNPNDAIAMAYYAYWLWMQGDAEAAQIHYRNALALDPLSLARYADLGNKLAFSGLREEALALAGQVLELFPTANGYRVVAHINESLGELDEAIAWLFEAHQLQPQNPDINGELAELLERIGARELANEMEPSDSVSRFYWQRRWSELAEFGENLLFEEQSDIELVHTVAFAHAALGEFNSAIRWYESAGLPATALSESRRANDIHALMAYTCTLWASGDTGRASQLLDQSRPWRMRMSSSDGAENWVLRITGAMVSLMEGRRNEALSQLETLPDLGTLARLPWLLDNACLQGLAGEPRYEAVVSAVSSRTDRLRQRLGATLDRHGLTLFAVGSQIGTAP